jgi:LPS-assembly protein
VYLKASKGVSLSCGLFLWTATAFAQTTTPAPATGLPLGISNFSSWRFEQVGDHLHLIGQAAIQGAEIQFFADDVDLYVDTNRIVASGNVVFSNADGRISAERVEFNTATGAGTFYDAAGIMSLGAKAGAGIGGGSSLAAFGGQDPDVYFYGEILEKLGPRRYRITRGGFSTCVQPTPRWEVTSGTLSLNLDDYAFARNTLLRVKGVPMLYLPVMYYPIQDSQRATGFLIPTYGTSSLRGQSLSNAFFWAIDRSQDATFFHDWFTRTGMGEGGEYRYISGPQSAGNFRAYRFVQHETEFNESGQTTTLPAETNFEFNGTMTQALGTARARMRLDYFSNALNQQLYHQNIYEASRRSRLIEGGISDTFGPVATSFLYQRNETFNNDTSSVLHGSTPRVTAILAPQQLLGAPIYASVNNEYAYLPYRYLNNGVTTLDNSLSRVDIAPSLRVPLSRLTYLSLNSSVAPRLTYYSRSYGPKGVLLPDSIIRQYTQFRTDIVGPVVTKIWDTPDSSYSERMKHVIEPAFTIDYTTPISNQEDVPVLTDTSDVVVGDSSRLTYGLTNRLLYRGKSADGGRGQTREFVTIGVQQTYYSNPEASRADTSYASANLSDKPADLSPIALNVRVSPSSVIDANSRLEYDVSGLGLTLWSMGSSISVRRTSGSLNYSRRRLSGVTRPDSYLSGSTSLSSPNGHITGSYALSWDITRRNIVTQDVVATYMAQCCGVQVGFQKFNFPQNSSAFPIASDRRFNLSFVLAGLGTVSNFFGVFGNIQ